MRTHLTKSELKDLIKYLKANRQVQLTFLIEAIARLGCRTIELTKLEASDVDTNRGFVLVHGAKGSKDRVVPVDKVFASCLKTRLELEGGSPQATTGHQDRITTFVRALRRHWDEVRLACFGIGFKTVTLHGLRASFALAVYEDAQDVLEVKALLGHKQINSTMAYVEYSKAQERAPAIRKLFGK